MIKHTLKKLPKSEIELEVSVACENWESHIAPAVESLAKNMKTDGFRPGKAPRAVVERNVGSRVILEEAADRTIRKTYAELIEKEKLDTIGTSRAEIVQAEEGKELVYKIKTAVMPTVKMKDWRENVSKLNREYKEKKVEAEEKEIDKEIEKLAESRAKLITVRRGAKNGDTLLVDFQVSRSGVPIENGSSKNHPVVLGKQVFVPGFEEALLDMREQEEKEFELKFPETYHEKSLAGKPATFKVKVNLVQEKHLPEIGDEFAKSLGKFQTLTELKKSIGDGIKMEKEKKIKEEKNLKLVDILTEAAEIDLPEVLVEGEIEKMVNEFESQLGTMGMTLEKYLEQIKKERADLEKDWRSQAEKRVKAALALEEMAAAEKVELSAEEIEAEMNKTLQYFKKTQEAMENVDMRRLYNYVKSQISNQKVFEYLEKL